MKTIVSILLFTIFLGCSNTNANKIKTDIPPELLPFLAEDSLFYYLYFRDREVDKSLTSNCGEASRGTTAVANTGQQNTQTTQNTTNSTRFTILNKYVIKTTGESLNLKFNYDSTTQNGTIDQQQGFTLTGGFFNSTLTGVQGTVEWGQGGTNLGYLSESTTGTQFLTYMRDIKVTLFGTFKRNLSSSATVPNECFTQDNVNCTTANTSTKCFTSDNRVCLVSSTTGGVPITLKVNINCESDNFITNQ
jgi:hypothetical protein